MLTEKVLGEKRHEFQSEKYLKGYGGQPDLYQFRCSCGVVFRGYPGTSMYEREVGEHRNNRTFTTWQDLGDVMSKMIETRKWKEFWLFSYTEWPQTQESFASDFVLWLFRPVNEKGKPHFCRLVVKFIEERRK